MLSFSYFQGIIRPCRWFGLGALVAVLPFCAAASTVTVDFGINLNSVTGTGTFTYDPAAISTAGGLGPYADSADGLQSFSLTYDGTTYTDTSADLLAGPTIFLPGNSTIQHGLQYGIFGLWVISGSCTGTGTAGDFACTGPGGVGDATILGLGRSVEAFLLTGVSTAEVAFSGSDIKYNVGSAPAIQQIAGTITSEVVATPEPAVFPLCALGLAGLWLARRRKASL